MWNGQFSLHEFLSLFEEELFLYYFPQKRRRYVRWATKKAKRSLQKNWKKPRIGWGERKREVEDALDEIRRLREY